MENHASKDSRAMLFQEAESKTNRDNLICLCVLAGVMLLCEILNEVGIFKIVPLVMRVGAGCSILCFLLPVVFLWRPMNLFKKNGVASEYRSWHKYFILTFTWLGTIAAGITLTHHTVIAMAVPLLIMAQYRDPGKLVPLTVVLATLCVVLGVYGGYFIGCFDANLLHIGITDDNMFDLELRLGMATFKRMTELLTHYILPREITVLALIFLSTKISHRNDDMLRHQAKLQSAVEQEMQRTNDIQWQIIDGMANLIENRDTSTGEHVKRTSFYVDGIVRQLRTDSPYQSELTDKTAETIVRAAPLHDIGKIVVADRILQKPGRLTPEEYEEIKNHASEGAKVIENVLGSVEDEVFLAAAKDISGGHHERWDGRGYPNGLVGEQIPLSARIMAVADVFDALVSKRVYKESIPAEEAFAIIESEAGHQFDPAVVRAFCDMKPKVLEYLQG